MGNRVNNPNNILPAVQSSVGSKTEAIEYSYLDPKLAFVIGKTAVVLGSEVIDKAVGLPLNESLDQTLVEFGIAGKNGNIVQATGANNKVYSWNGMLFTKDPLATKQKLENLILANNPIPYKVFFMNKAALVFVQQVTFAIQSECIVEYSIVCVEYTPPEIVSFDAQIWMDIVGDFNNINTDLDDIEDDPCLQGPAIIQSDESKKVTVASLKEALKERLGVGDTSEDVSAASIYEFMFGDLSLSDVFQKAMDCDVFAKDEKAQKIFQAIMNYCIYAFEQAVMALDPDNQNKAYLDCIEEHAMESDYEIYRMLVDKMFYDGVIEIRGISDGGGVQGTQTMFTIFENGEIDCDALEACIRYWSFYDYYIMNISFTTSVLDVVFNEDCCSGLKVGGQSFGGGGSSGGFGGGEDGDTGGEIEPEEKNKNIFCNESFNSFPKSEPELNWFLVPSFSEQLKEYTCWKTEDGTNYTQIDCDGDDWKKNYSHEKYFKSYDNNRGTVISSSSPHIKQTQNGIKLNVGEKFRLSFIYDLLGSDAGITFDPSGGGFTLSKTINDVEYQINVTLSGGELYMEYVINGEYFNPSICFFN
jgi:hypothetical protein